ERVAGLRMQRVLHHDAIRLPVGRSPCDPAHEAVDRVAGFGLGERKLVPAARELVGAVLEPARPGNEHLAPSGGSDLLFGVAVQDVAFADGVGAQTAADLDDDGALVSCANLDLLAGRQHMRHQPSIRWSRWSPTRSEFAIAVSAGLTAPIDGKTLV